MGVFSTPGFYAGFIGLPRAPETLDEWLAIPENCLAAATNGKLFLDPGLGFSLIREKLLGFYPEDVRKKKIASRAMTVAQAGQYNFGRLARRGDLFGARYSEIKFLSDAISMIYLLNRRYAPFYKWMHRGLERLPVLGKRVAGLADALLSEPDFKKKERLIAEICRLAADELRRQGLSSAEGDFLADHGPAVAGSIEDAALRSRNVWVG